MNTPMTDDAILELAKAADQQRRSQAELDRIAAYNGKVAKAKTLCQTVLGKCHAHKGFIAQNSKILCDKSGHEKVGFIIAKDYIFNTDIYLVLDGTLCTVDSSTHIISREMILTPKIESVVIDSWAEVLVDTVLGNIDEICGWYNIPCNSITA